jgi:hypothetical protein
MELRYFLACLAMVTGAEVGARLLRLWLYRSGWLQVACALGSSAALAALVTALAGQSFALRALIGAALGIAYEGANLRWLHWWTFPGNRLFWLRGAPALALAAGAPWGLLAAAAPLMAAYLP